MTSRVTDVDVATMTEAECGHVLSMSIGRILRMSERAPRRGDEAEYDRIRGLVIHAVLPRLRELGSDLARGIDRDLAYREQAARRRSSW